MYTSKFNSLKDIHVDDDVFQNTQQGKKPQPSNNDTAHLRATQLPLITLPSASRHTSHLPIPSTPHSFPRRLTFGDHAFQEDDVGVVKLAHDGGLREEVQAVLLRGSGLEGLDGHGHLGPTRDT